MHAVGGGGQDGLGDRAFAGHFAGHRAFSCGAGEAAAGDDEPGRRRWRCWCCMGLCEGLVQAGGPAFVNQAAFWNPPLNPA